MVDIIMEANIHFYAFGTEACSAVWKIQMTPRASLESFMTALKYRLFEKSITMNPKKGFFLFVFFKVVVKNFAVHLFNRRCVENVCSCDCTMKSGESPSPYLLLSWRCLRYPGLRKERLFAVSKQLVFVLWMSKLCSLWGGNKPTSPLKLLT